MLLRLPNKRPKTILLDNAKIHHYLKLKKYVGNVKNVTLLYNVPYSPETNPIEKVFSEVKRNLRNVFIDNNNIVGKIKKSFTDVKKK
jgi:transposase